MKDIVINFFMCALLIDICIVGYGIYDVPRDVASTIPYLYRQDFGVNVRYFFFLLFFFFGSGFLCVILNTISAAMSPTRAHSEIIPNARP